MYLHFHPFPNGKSWSHLLRLVTKTKSVNTNLQKRYQTPGASEVDFIITITIIIAAIITTLTILFSFLFLHRNQIPSINSAVCSIGPKLFSACSNTNMWRSVPTLTPGSTLSMFSFLTLVNIQLELPPRRWLAYNKSGSGTPHLLFCQFIMNTRLSPGRRQWSELRLIIHGNCDRYNCCYNHGTQIKQAYEGKGASNKEGTPNLREQGCVSSNKGQPWERWCSLHTMRWKACRLECGGEQEYAQQPCTLKPQPAHSEPSGNPLVLSYPPDLTMEATTLVPRSLESPHPAFNRLTLTLRAIRTPCSLPYSSDSHSFLSTLVQASLSSSSSLHSLSASDSYCPRQEAPPPSQTHYPVSKLHNSPILHRLSGQLLCGG